MKKLIVTLITGTLLAACSAENTTLTGVPKPPAAPLQRPAGEVTSDGVNFPTPDSRVDVLFIIDDSLSMSAHQQNLSANVGQFVDAIAQVKNIDFHIGYTMIYDSTRYGAGNLVSPVCGAETDAPGRVNYYEPGTLNPLRGPAISGNRRFVTRDDDFKTILKESLDPLKNKSLIKDLINPTKGTNQCAGGAEEEESFRPILGAVENAKLVGNEGFRRPGAFFVAIIVSDAKDGGVSKGEYTPDTVVNRITAATGATNNGHRNFRIFSVAIKPGSEFIGPAHVSYDGQPCEADPAFALKAHVTVNGTHYEWPAAGDKVGENSNPLASLARLTEDDDHGIDQVLSICDANYGQSLANFGNKVKQDVLTDIVIPVPRTQVFAANGRNLRVMLGDAELDHSLWYLDINALKIVVHAQKIDWTKYAGKSLHALFTPVNDAAPTTKPVK